MKKLILEIHRRSLWQVLGIYLAGSWGALQVVDVLANNFGLPDWFPALALSLLVLGLPVVLATAFVQEGLGGDGKAPGQTPAQGPAQGEAIHAGGRERSALFTWRNAAIGGVAAALLWTGVALGWMVSGRRAAAGSTPDVVAAASAAHSIAVLPFTSVRTDEESQSFRTGIHDDILTQLSKIDALKVISRTSVMQYDGTTKPIREISAELGVSTVLTGGVQRAGDRVRVTVQLVDAAADASLWAESYDRALTAENIFQIQSDVASSIARALAAELSPDVAARLADLPTRSLEAYDLYTRGRYIASSRGSTRQGQEAALELFEHAIAADPGFAAAHLGLAQARFNLWGLGYLTEGEALPRVRADLERALTLDPLLAEAHAMSGSLLRTEGRLAEAEVELRRALELNPNSAAARGAYSALLLGLDRTEEAVAEARRAVELDPLSAAARRSLLARLVFAREYDAALVESRKLLELEPNEADAHYYAALAHTMKGDHESALEAYRRSMELNPEDPYYPAGIAWAYARAGDRREALRFVERAEDMGVPLKEVALVHGALGDLDVAFHYLDRALETERATLAGLSADPASDVLKQDRRWSELMERLKVSP